MMFGMLEFAFSVRKTLEEIGGVLKIHKRRLDAHSSSLESVVECLRAIADHLGSIDRQLGLVKEGEVL